MCRERETDIPTIDAFAAHEWATASQLAPYLPDGWREVLTEPGVGVHTPPLYPDLAAARAGIGQASGNAFSGGDAPGSAATHAEFARAYIDPAGHERVVLGCERAMRATTNQNHFVGHALAQATNRWTEEEWLSRDERLFGLVMAVGALPHEAAEEIRRSGSHPRMVGVTIGSASLGSPLGHPVYHPILEAAAELKLPLVMQAGIDATQNAITPPVIGGLPATVGEYRTLSWQPQMAHVSSMIMQGVFDRFPDLKVLLLGAGALWLPGQLWRLDHRFAVSRGDGRWLERRPSEYADHIYVSTFRLESAPRPEQLVQALAALPGVEERLVYASGYPSVDSQDLETALGQLPHSWHDNVSFETAAGLFRWPEISATAPPPRAEVSV